MTDHLIVVDSLPKEVLDEARQRLESEKPVEQVVSPRALAVRFQAVQAVQARLNNCDVALVYDSGGKRIVTRRITMATREAQAEFLHAARERMPDGSEVSESSSNRVFYALPPFHVFVVFAVLAAFAHAFFTSEATDPQSNRMAIVQAGRIAGRGAQAAYYASATRLRVSRMVGRTFGAGRLAGLVVIAAAAVAGILTIIGQTVSMVILLSGALATLLWTMARLLDPPRTLSVVALR